MFDVGFSKLLIILAVALIVLGPEKLPAVAGQIGRWLGRARTMARQFRDQLEEEASSIQSVKRAAAQPAAATTAGAASGAADVPPPEPVMTGAGSYPHPGIDPAAASGTRPAAPLVGPLPDAISGDPYVQAAEARAAEAHAAAVAQSNAALAPAPTPAPAYAATPDYAAAPDYAKPSVDERGA